MGDKKKVGVLTFVWSLNYGAMLQAYALKKQLEALGYDPVLVPYVPESRANDLRLKYRPLGRRTLYEILRRAKFTGFLRRDLMVRTPFFSSADRMGGRQYADLHAWITGSDQVWNPNITRAFDSAYFLGFNTPSGCRKISYAASCGEIQSQGVMEKAGKLLCDFDSVSVRDRLTASMVEQSTGSSLQSSMVLDPTLLHDFSEWNTEGTKPRSYVFSYFVNPRNPESAALIRTARQILKCPVYNGCVYGEMKDADRNLRALGPKQWVQAIRNAAFVCTDSFHGTVFALKYNKPFIAVRNGERTERLADILGMSGLSERLVSAAEEASSCGLFAEMDFSESNRTIQQLRDRSLEFLEQALG